VVDVFFSKLGGALKKFFASATGKDYLPTNSMKKYLDELAQTNNPLQGSYTQPKEEKPTPKQPTKKESRLIEIDDEIDAAAKKLADVFKNMGKGTLNSGVDPVIIGKVLAIGVELSVLYLNKGAVKFSIWAENVINSLSKNGVPQDIVQPYLKRLYFASKADVSSEIRKQMDNDDDVIDFDFATLNVGQQQTKGKANELPQLDSTSTKPLEGVSANDVQGIGSQRSTGGKTSGGGGTNLSGNERTGGAGLSTTRIMGDDTGEVSDTARGKGTERLAVTPAQDIATDFVITDGDNIGGGGLKTKYRNNVAAIRVLKQVESEGREATNEEQKILAKWVGWGSLYQAFRYSDGSIAKGWDKEVKELAELLTPEEMTAAVDSSVAAHYTSPKVVEAMWKAVQQLGFKNGKVLEPSVGSGNFFGAMPAKLRNSALLHGVELDNITGGIAKLLYPKAKIKAAMGFQDYAVPDGYFDLVIGNPPFGNIKITDKTQRHLDGFTLHNYFFAKSIDALREGGVLAMVVTNRLMDASNANDKARQYIDEHAELLGAVRLPNNAFLKNAGTQVTTDIIFLRKRVAGEDITTNKWMNVRQYQDKNGKTVPLNEYFHANPEMMLGEFGAYGSMYAPDDPALVARDGQDTLALLNDAIAKLPKSVMPTVEKKSEEMAEKTAQDIPDVKVGSMFVEDGDIYIRQQDSLGERQADVVTLSGKAVGRVKGMISIRDAFILVRDAQLSPNKDSELPLLRKKLNVAYDSFVKTNGFINDDANKRLMHDDPSWPQLSALEEKYDKGLSAAVAKTTGEVARPVSASKAAIFNVRTQFPYATITSVSSAKDGYVESLNRYGKLDIDFVANLYGQSVGDTITELGNLIYQDPVRGWVTSSDYLSGNVKLKLQAAKLSLKAQEAAKGELEALPPIEQLHRGITALEAVIPEDIESVDIDIRAGAHWLPPKHIADFAREMLGINGNVGATYNKFDASWSVDFNQNNLSAAKKTEWSTDRKTAAQILNAALNHKQLTVYDDDGSGVKTVNTEATAAANEKVAHLKRAWADWIWHDDNRRVELSRLYNDIFNTDAPTVFDGQHLTLAGKIDDDVLRLRPHQNDGIWRITQSDSTLLDHVVGAGKTFTMIGGAMELRRMGKSNKPMFVVPNHLVGQWAADFIKLYPSANILAATKADFEAKNRKKLFARIATGDWDAVIVAHSSFGKVSLHPDEEAKFIKKEIEEMMEAEALARKEGGEKARNAKDIGKRRLAKEDKLKKLLATKNKDDDNVYWSELGVDSLFVDEAHEFKNLAFTSTIQRVAGLGNQAGSQKATDLFTKIVSLKDRVAGAKVVFATGTPISNTMAEMYTMQRYLDLERMVHQGTVLFDAWARTFGEVVSDWELSPAGKYKMNSRFAKFVNMPELMQGYLSFADVINRDDINRQLAARGETLGTPKIRTGKPQNIVVERSQDQADYIGEASIDSNGNESYPKGSLVYRAENIPKKQEKGADNMLKIMSDARKAALDMRLIDPSLPDNPNSKVNEAIRRILTTYRQWNDDKGVQLVFCDLSTPKGAIAQEKARIEELVRLADEGDEAAIKELDEMSPDELDALNSSFSVYDDMKAKLIAQGIPANQVAFIHDAKTDIQKEALFGKVRSGQIRVLIGSTAKMGAGMNVQDKLVALHHLDAPWRPSDLEQREGRIIRQKNEFYKRDPEGFEVDIMRYATKQTLDSRMWQTLEGKARFIEQIRKGDIKSRSVEDIGGEAANAAEMKAASSGNPLILEEMTLRREVQNLEAEKQRHVREQHRLKSTAKRLTEENEYLEKEISKMEIDAKLKTPEEFEMTVGRKMFKQGEEKARERAGKALSDAAKDIYIKDESRVVGKFGDFDIVARLNYYEDTTFRVRAKSGLSYGEFRFDAENDSMAGLTLRIANIANSIEGLLGGNKATIENNNKEIPKVQALLSNWKDSTKLDEARKKHTEIIDQLKPKEKVKVDEVKGDDQTKPIKPKFSRESPKNDNGIPIYRIDNKDFDAKKIKPHGLYVSIPDDTSAFDSPHKDVGDTSFAGYASPKNPLNVESTKIQHKRGNNYQIETSAGVSALRQLVDKPLFDSLIKADKKELTATIKEQFPDIDTSQYHDAYELLEVLGAQLAIQDGHDAIVQKNGDDHFNEMVILDNSIIESMSPLKSKTKEGGGLTVAQVRTTLVDCFGEKVIKALEDKGLIVYHAKISEVPKQFDVKQGDQGVYDPNTGITHLIAENLNPETVLPTMLHEMGGHAGFQTMLETKLYDALMGTFNRLVEAGNPIAIEAKKRAEVEQNKSTQEMEYLPYLLTVAQQELQTTNLQKSAITKLIDRIISGVRAFAFEKLGIRLELTTNDMVALAERMIKALASETNQINNTKGTLQKGIARREFLIGLGAISATLATGGAITLLDQQIKNVQKESAKESIDSLAQSTYKVIIEQMKKSDSFIAVITKASKAQASTTGKKAAAYALKKMQDIASSELKKLNDITYDDISTGYKRPNDDTPVSVKKSEALKEAKAFQKTLNDNEAEIISVMNDAVAFVESIAGVKFDLLVINSTTPLPATDILTRKAFNLSNHDTELNAMVENSQPRTVVIHPYTMANLVSKDKRARLHAFQTLTHELSHVLQNQEGKTLDNPLGVVIDLPVSVKRMVEQILSQMYQNSPYVASEIESFSIGYTATKALQTKENQPLTISETELLNLINASIDSFNTPQEVTDSFYRKTEFINTALFSRASNGQPNPSPTNPKLDRLLHGIEPGEKLFNALAQPIHKWLDDHSSSQWKLVNNMPPAFKQMMREYLRDQKASEEQTKNIVENGIAMSSDERNLLSDVLEKMVASGTTIPEHIVQVAAAMRSALSGQTDELVRLGMLSEDSAERWRDTYLPRLYDKAAKDPINRALAKRLNIVGDHLKGRGIFREVEEKLEAKYEKLGWENRGKGKKGHVIMWRDYTPEERVKMGEIRDALHRFATGFLDTQRDIATGRLLEKIANNTDLASVDPVAGWTLVPTATIKETGGVKRYGKLSGMYVHPDVWENTKHYIDDRDGLMEMYRQTLSVWKQGKTALNVVAHMNNVVSNAVMVTAAGANMADVARGYDSIMKEDQYYKEAKELGMLASGHFTGDIRDYFGGEIQDATTPSNFVFKAFKAAWRNKGFEFMRKMYDAEDQLFRMSLYRKARELGATQAESIDYAETFMFNYADLPAGIKKIRDFGLPFISYTYKAVPAVTRLAFTQPHRVLALVGMVYAFNAIAYAMLGADADEDKERKNLPDYMQGFSAWGVPKLVRLPWNDGEKAAFLDIYRWAPLGDFFAFGNRTGGADVPTWAMMSGPYWSFYNTMIQNRNGLTGKNYLEDTDTDRQVFFKRMKFGLSEWIPMYYHLDKNLNAVRNEMGDTPMSKLLEGMGYTGTDMRGDPAELKNSLLGATGIKVRKLDIEDQKQRKLIGVKSEVLDRKRQINRIRKDQSNPYKERDIAAQVEEIKRLREKAQEIRQQ
jgi:N12 class adenine-specific DNA methylase/predicted RNA methylase